MKKITLIILIVSLVYGAFSPALLASPTRKALFQLNKNITSFALKSGLRSPAGHQAFKLVTANRTFETLSRSQQKILKSMHGSNVKQAVQSKLEKFGTLF